MLLVFVDETSDKKFKNYLGFCVATINSRSYSNLKAKAQKILRSIDWDPKTEFKGAFLFSASKGCPDVEIERRIDAAHKLLDLNISLKNSRIRFYYGSMDSRDHATDYLRALPGLLMKLPPAPKGAGKNLVAALCDNRSDIDSATLHEAVSTALQSRGYVVLERVVQATSTLDTVGLMFADLVGYLAGRVETISNDAELYDGLTPEQFETNGKIKKLLSSSELIKKIKALKVYQHEARAQAT